MFKEILFAGFGGQGVLLMGQFLTNACMLSGYHVSWLPSYGPEQRGGTANTAVVISDRKIGSPLVTKPSILVALNTPSFEKFEPAVKSGGMIFMNKSLISNKKMRKDIKVFEIDATNMATELGNQKVANMILLGALVEATKIVSVDFILETLVEAFGKKKCELLEINKLALEKGIAAVLNSAV